MPKINKNKYYTMKLETMGVRVHILETLVWINHWTEYI